MLTFIDTRTQTHGAIQTAIRETCISCIYICLVEYDFRTSAWMQADLELLPDARVYISAPDKYLGYKLHSYGQVFTFSVLSKTASMQRNDKLVIIQGNGKQIYK